MRKKVLVVCMLNSVHSAKWLAQFKDSEIDFYLFPSSYFKSLHPILRTLKVSNSAAGFHTQRTLLGSGWDDYFQERFLSKISRYFSRRDRLTRYLMSSNPDFVHALEFQHSAYLCSEVIEKIRKNFIFIATNWGSDIFHFKNIPNHETKIRKVLSQADKYSAECTRDIKLATELGFSGEFLPVFPNAGGFSVNDISIVRSIASSRKLLLIKGYGGYFGRIDIVVRALGLILNDFKQYYVHIYSVTDDVVKLVENFRNRFPGRVNFSTVDKPLNYAEMQILFAEARIYLGCSVSDGISTSFLEALVAGAYPIQTNTSCAQEWIEKGAVGSIISLDECELVEAVSRALSDDDLVDYAQEENKKVALEHLDCGKIKAQSLEFYSSS